MERDCIYRSAMTAWIWKHFFSRNLSLYIFRLDPQCIFPCELDLMQGMHTRNYSPCMWTKLCLWEYSGWIRSNKHTQKEEFSLFKRNGWIFQTFNDIEAVIILNEQTRNVEVLSGCYARALLWTDFLVLLRRKEKFPNFYVSSIYYYAKCHNYIFI